MYTVCLNEEWVLRASLLQSSSRSPVGSGQCNQEMNKNWCLVRCVSCWLLFYVEYVFDKLLVLFMHESWSNTLIFAFFKIFTLIFYTHDTEPEVVFNFHPELQIYSDQAMAEKSICKKNFNCTNISTVLAFHLIFM